MNQLCPQRHVFAENYTVRFIEAAPQILRGVSINDNGHSGVFKWLNPFRIEEHIDLTILQSVDSLPLRYTLSSVIARGGPEDNIEHVLSEDEAVQMREFGEDPENEETLRREREETL